MKVALSPHILLAATLSIGTVAAHALPFSVPSCPNPARYVSHHDCPIATEYLYLVKVTGDPTQTTAALEKAYDFHHSNVLTSLGWFTSLLSPRVIAQLRCDSRVLVIEENSLGQFEGSTTPPSDSVCNPSEAEVPLFGGPALLALASVLALMGVMARKG